MLLQSTEMLPEDPIWNYELKLDGYRAIAIKSNGKVYLRSRNDKDFSARYPAIAVALALLPNETVVDGEVVALDPTGKPSFNALQNYGSSQAPILFYVFDVLILSGRDVMSETLSMRQRLLDRRVLPKLTEPIRQVPRFDSKLADMIKAVRAQGLEGIVAKQLDSVYEPGKRSGVWQKMRINKGQEFVLGGYTKGGRSFDALVFGYYQDGQLLYVSRTRNGFTPVARERLLKRFEPLEIARCPFTNLPELRAGRWGQGLTAEKMIDCVWLRPVLVGQFEFAEWTPDNHLRHSRFVALRDDKKASDVVRER
jgi:bifunctional non-homologous end joining protein LigD